MRGLRKLRQRRQRLRPLDIAAVIIALGYAFLAISSQSGANVAGQGLDPVWAAAQQRGALRIAVDFGFYPFSGVERGADGQDVPIGYDIDLARAVAQKLGLRAEFVPSSLDAIYEDLAGGKADMAASALPYAPHQGWRVNFSTFYFNAGQVLVVPVDSSITGIDQLAGTTIGAPLGSDADTYARKLAMSDPSITLRSDYDMPAEALADLRRGKLDAVIVDNASALIAIGNADGLRLVEPALTLEPYVLAVPSRAYLLHEQINQALDELRNEGFFEENGRRWLK
ncbi:MAG: amino acid ABC transporter substrate-binding protein [Blastochloris sp.]|nr:amino acid ABC transporter substrate-binding protein [Blastochloris sp.]